jgi:hypothetical protein
VFSKDLKDRKASNTGISRGPEMNESSLRASARKVNGKTYLPRI